MRTLLLYLTLIGLLIAAGPDGFKSNGGLAGETPDTREKVSLRTKTSQTFETADGKRLNRVYSEQRYFRAGTELRAIRLTAAEDTSGGFTRTVEAGPYTWRYHHENHETGYRIECKGYHVTYYPAGDWTGKAAVFTPLPEGVKEEVRIARDSGVTVQWRIETDAEAVFGNGAVEFFGGDGERVFYIPAPWAADAAGRNVPVAARLDGDILTCTIDPPEGTAWPVIIDPYTIAGDYEGKTGSAMAYSIGTYTDARNDTTAYTTYLSTINVGQYYDSQNTRYYIHRGFLTFDTSALPVTAIIDSARVKVSVNLDYSYTDFNITLVEGTFDTGGDLSAGWFNDFAGWSASGAYPVTPLSGSVNTAGISVGDTLSFTLNGNGLPVISKTGCTTFALLSGRDIAGTPPTQDERVCLHHSTPYIEIWYRENYVNQPEDFQMTAIDTATVVCIWTDASGNEECFYIVDLADSSIVDSLAADATCDTIRGLAVNGKYVWAVAADSSGWRNYSAPDSAHTLLPPPQSHNISVMPVSSDTLRITADSPPNGSSGETGMEVTAVSGSGATNSGWRTGTYSYPDGGLDPYSAYVYKVRYRNGDGIPTEWSPEIQYTMNGLDTLVVHLSGDRYDDYNTDFGSGEKTAALLRVGAGDGGERLDGFLVFEIPWQVHKGGVDDMFLTMRRTAEQSGTSPVIPVYGIPVTDMNPIETLDAGSQDSTGVIVSWTISSGEGERTSPDLRPLFRSWQDLNERRDYHNGFGIRLDDGSQADGVRAVFTDASNPSYADDTYLTVVYTPGTCDMVDAAPDGFSITALGPDAVIAEWNDNATTEYGYVLLNHGDSSPVAEADTLDAGTSSAVVSGLKPDTLYDWFVRAYTVYDDSSSAHAWTRTPARTPGMTSVEPAGDRALRFVIDPLDNPEWTEFAVQDSLSGKYIDGSAEPDTLRPGPLGDWGWRTFGQWGGAPGDTLAGLSPDTRYVLRAKARGED